MGRSSLPGGTIERSCGLGDVVYNWPALALSTAGFLVSVQIFITGFVCDFIMHH
jgi:hypothetical protein